MCQFMYVSCSCCRKRIFKKYKDFVCSARTCAVNKIIEYYSGVCNKCEQNCKEVVCFIPDLGSSRIVYTNVRKTNFEKIIHFFGIEHFLRYRNSNFKGVENYLKKINKNSRLIHF